MARRFAILSFMLVAVCSCVLSDGVEISIYSLSVDEFNEMSTDFADYVSIEATEYCTTTDETICPEDFQNSNLTAELSDVKLSKPDLNVTVVIKSPDAVILSKEYTKKMLNQQRENLNMKSSQQITAVGEDHHSKDADNPTNWIIVAVFAVATIILLLVVVYLSKHKVNHVDEHYEMMDTKDKSADGEIAA